MRKTRTKLLKYYLNLRITTLKLILVKKLLLFSLLIISQLSFGQFDNLPEKTAYFKPPSSWTTPCSYMNFIDPVVTIDFYPPGNPMTSACEGWYKITYAFNKAYVEFNNCNYISGSPNTNYLYYALETETDIFYDYSEGPISNPPACLLAVNDSSKIIAVVKIFPNPVQDYVNIESEKNFIAYEIIDGSGKSILNKDFKSPKIDISNLKTGVYFIKLKSLSNETNIVKFIKK